MSHRTAHSKSKTWSNSANLKGKQREEEEIDELDPESESETMGLAPPASAHHPQMHSARMSVDTHPQWETISSTTSSSKAGGKKIAKGHGQDKPTPKDNPHIPFARMESILHADPDNGPISKEAIHLILGATEHFIRRLSKAAHTRSKLENRAITTYKDVADTAHYFEEFNFLEEMIPRPMPLKLALSERVKKVGQSAVITQGGTADEKPSTAYTSETASSASTAKGKGKRKTAATNGRSLSTKQVNGNANAYADSHNDESISSPLLRQRSKRARVGNAHADNAPSKILNGSASTAGGVSRSTSLSMGGGMKIKIRPRSSAPASDRTPNVNGVPNGVLPLGPPSHSRVTSASSKNSNGVVFAPPGVSDAPLWTRVPLPPPPSPRTKASDPSAASHSQQNNRIGRTSTSASGPGMDYRGALSPNAPNPGRTIYSQR